MKYLLLFIVFLLSNFLIYAQSLPAAEKNTVFIDKSGVMRWQHSKQEASFYGVNYTVPFAHAYRALIYKGIDHKAAIDRDVYHMARLGYNAYRIHIWDVEISDSSGNLLNNQHLDLMDYLFYKLEENGIHTLITMMTNFGNGYPEKNINTGAFTYLYDKCNVHAHPEAIKAQKKYITQLINHKNPYNGKIYKNDPFIVGFEINNEPCHTGDITTTRNYVRTMLDAFKSAGNKKPIFYNVSHNESHVPAYYQPGVQGTTYQWYPIGLVGAKERKGNFLPYVDSYAIRFNDVKDFDKKSLAVYEYDPADMLGSYLHPAMARTFRSTGFQWITQFAYDPIDIAQYNTEYQTHYLNLAYTPAKALSTMIAAEVAYQIPRKQTFPAYPDNTQFGNFMVSYEKDLAVLNDGVKFYYTNNNNINPLSTESLRHIAGVGSSTLVDYVGNGAYFLDQLEQGVWRLEVMPDVELISDPFEKPSLNKAVAAILWNSHPMVLGIPDLGKNFQVEKITDDPNKSFANGATFNVRPGVYILKSKERVSTQWNSDSKFKHGKVKDFYAPKPSPISSPIVRHEPFEFIEREDNPKISLKVLHNEPIDSVILQSDRVSFWRENNPYLKLQPSGNLYTVLLDDSLLKGKDLVYTITVFTKGKKYTFPDNMRGEPLDWDYLVKNYYTSKIVSQAEPIILLDSRNELHPSLEQYAIPDTSFLSVEKHKYNFDKPALWNYELTSKHDSTRFFWRKYIRNTVESRATGLNAVTKMLATIDLTDFKGSIQIGFISRKGFTYVKSINSSEINQHQIEVDFKDLKLAPTAILPAPYPVFLNRYFIPQVYEPFEINDIEQLFISTSEMPVGKMAIQIGAVWLQ